MLNVKPSSMQTYHTLFKNQIIPHLGEEKVQDLTPAKLDKWIRELQQAGLSYNSISAIHAFLHNALNYAVYPAQLISSNPAAYIKVPKNAPKNIVKRTIITPEQFQPLLEKYPFGSAMYILLLLLYHTGMRLGEVLGLSWADIDFAVKRINLSRQLVYIHKRGYYLTTTKTESSKRYILIDDYLLGELKRWQNQQAENEKKLGGKYICIYCGANGHIVRQSKCLPAPDGEKVSLLCILNDEKLYSRTSIINLLHYRRA